MKNDDQFIKIKGARQNNLKNLSLEIPRNQIVVFTGISGSGKSSLAFGTLYAEAERRYLESVSPYARRLFNQMSVPEVDSIEGLPPAVALQQHKGHFSGRSTVGSLTTISNSLRMLYSRAGTYPKGMDMLYADSFSPNTPEGACPRCHGLGHVLDTTLDLMVPDKILSISEKALAWPGGWHAKNMRDMLVSLEVDVNVPWKKLPKKTRDWILYTKDTPKVPVYADYTLEEAQEAIANDEDPSYMGNFQSVRESLLATYVGTQSQNMRKRVGKFLVEQACPDCHGHGLKKEALKVQFGGLNIVEISSLSFDELYALLQTEKKKKRALEIQKAVDTICEDVLVRIKTINGLGLEHLAVNRKTPTLSTGEHQRLRLATQLRSDLFGVVYVLDEPAAGLHEKDVSALIEIFEELKSKGNSVFIVEHNKDVILSSDWIVDIGPLAGSEGGEIVYNGVLSGLKMKKKSMTGQYLFHKKVFRKKERRTPQEFINYKNLALNNLKNVSLNLPLGVMCVVEGVSGSGKTSLLTEIMDKGPVEPVNKIVQITQDPIGRTPRSNIATYTGVFDYIRKLFAKTAMAKKRKYGASRFSFNVPGGRCENCSGDGQVEVELLFLPSVHSPCPVCKGKRYNEKTLEVKYKGKSVADVLELRVAEAMEFFKEHPEINRGLEMLKDVGLGYIQLGQPATEISGGEAQRVKLAAELRKKRGEQTLFLLDEPSAGLHFMDVEKLFGQLEKLVERGNSVVVADHHEIIRRGSDWTIELGPGGGSNGGKILLSEYGSKLLI